MTDLELELTRKNEHLTQQNEKLEKDITEISSLFGRLWHKHTKTCEAYNRLKHDLHMTHSELNNLKDKIMELLGYKKSENNINILHKVGHDCTGG